MGGETRWRTAGGICSSASGPNESRAEPSPRTPPSPKRRRSAWSGKRRGGEWKTCIAESPDEHGRYVVREHHSEAPYLDGTSLTEELELIAA
jgi:hypothetical protein